MADHLVRKPRGMWGTLAIAVAVLVFVLVAPRPALADGAASVAATQPGASVSVSVPTVSVSIPAVSVQAPAVSGSVPGVSVSVPRVSVSIRSASAPAAAVSVAAPVVHSPTAAVAAVAAMAPAQATASVRTPGPASHPAVVITAAGRVHRRSAAGTRIRSRAASTSVRRSRPGRGERVARATIRHPVVASSAPWSAGTGSVAPVARETPATHPRRDPRGSSARAVHRTVRPVHEAATTSPVVNLPATNFPAPAGSGGTVAGGAAAAAGAGAAVLLLLIALYGMRALLPGLLALGPSRWRSALLVCRLERPG